MSKQVKAIDLVWKAQPMIATLHTIMVKLAADVPGKSASGTVAEDCSRWLAAARGLLARKGAQWPAEPSEAVPPAADKHNNYTYVKCSECAKRGTPSCRHKGKRWAPSVIPGCMVNVEHADEYREVPQ